VQLIVGWNPCRYVTTNGTEPYSIQQLANDTSGLLDFLKIQKPNVLGTAADKPFGYGTLGNANRRLLTHMTNMDNYTKKDRYVVVFMGVSFVITLFLYYP
jgi:hypothetical protein